MEHFKCVCGYEYKERITSDDVKLGDKPPIRIRIAGHDFTIPASIDSSNYHYNDDHQIVGLYACPHCQTIQFDEI